MAWVEDPAGNYAYHIPEEEAEQGPVKEYWKLARLKWKATVRMDASGLFLIPLPAAEYACSHPVEVSWPSCPICKAEAISTYLPADCSHNFTAIHLHTTVWKIFCTKCGEARTI